MRDRKKQNSDSKSIMKLYNAWRKAEARACGMGDIVKDDYSQPRFADAVKKSHDLLHELLKPSSSLYGALIKLKIASYYEDYLRDAEDPECTVIAPRAVVSAIQDLESLIGAGNPTV
jgi:hypothetical protein